MPGARNAIDSLERGLQVVEHGLEQRGLLGRQECLRALALDTFGRDRDLVRSLYREARVAALALAPPDRFLSVSSFNCSNGARIPWR